MQATQALIPYSENADVKVKFYAELEREIRALADPIWFTALANVTASLKQHLPDINWVGFYLFKDGQLVLGPFQGLVACVRIPLGKGVCGTAFAAGQTLVVPDVEQFPGHIACDSASRSEIVIPIYRDSSKREKLGVLDIDSPKLNRFDDVDRAGLESIVNAMTESLSSLASYPDKF